jgi:hypothetical protein
MTMRLKLLTLMVAGLAATAFAPSLAAQPARGAAGACALSLPAEADNASFDDAGRVSGPARARLVQATGANFAAAASNLCGSGVVRAANLRPYRRLLVRNAEGATEPKIYDDAEELPGALIIEYVFEDAAPAQPAIEAALRCWRNPQAAGCAEEDVGP